MILRWTGWIILLVLAIATTWFVYSLDKKLLISTENKNHFPDYTLQNFTSIQMTQQGQVKSQLKAEMMLHYSDTNTKLTAPTMTFYKNTKPNWIVQAERGELSANGQQVWLLGHTIAQKQASLSQKTLKIISKDVRIQLDTEYAETSFPTKIMSAHSQTTGVGMQLFLPKEQINLLSKVQSYYTP